MEAPEFKLYETGFDETDFLNRKPLSDQLTTLLNGTSRPLVVALNAGWGSGKSFFLKRWIGEYAKSSKDEGSGIQGEVIYFDAFKNDYLDDPLVSLTHAISERLDLEDSSPTTNATSPTQKFKKFAPIVGRVASKIAITYATRGLYDSIDGLCKDGSDAESASSPTTMDTAKDAALQYAERITQKSLLDFSDRFWEAETIRTDAMAQFRKSLKQIVSEKQKLIIVIDELDRCRPDYALALLEVIKHFFSEPNIHFVLGVNLDELANMVCARYGANTDGLKYLQKFISLTIMLHAELLEFDQSLQTASKYISLKASSYEFNEEITKLIISYFNFEGIQKNTNLREVEKILNESSLCPLLSEVKINDKIFIESTIILGMIFFKYISYDKYKNMVSSNFRFKDDFREFIYKQKIIVKNFNYCNRIQEILLHVTRLNLKNELQRYYRIENDEQSTEILKIIHERYLQSFHVGAYVEKSYVESGYIK